MKPNKGMVVSFTSGGKYTYAAVFADGLWYVTGGGRYWGKDRFSHKAFMEILSESTDVRVATQWEEI